MASFSSTYPAQRPIFSLDAANAGRLDPRCSFTRADTPPTYAAPSAVHYWSNEKHLSSENLFKYSNDLDTGWVEDNLTFTSGQTAPDGGSDAFKITENSATNEHRFYPNAAISTDGGTTTFSGYFKYIGRQWIVVKLNDGSTDRRVWFDIQNGVVGTTNTGITASISASGGGYYKVVATIATSSTSYFPLIGGASADNVYVYAGSGADAFYVWGLQYNHNVGSVLNETSGQIHREYAPTLKSVATAGQPRFEYDPSADGQSAGTSLGILIEGSSTNLLPYSVGTSSWTLSQASRTSAAAIAPDGTQQAVLITWNGSSGSGYAFPSLGTVTSGTVYTGSVYVKAVGSSSIMQLTLNAPAFASDNAVNFTLTGDGSVGSSFGGATGAISSIGNGWYRVSITATAASSSSACPIVVPITSTTDARLPSFTSNRYDGLLCWGFQLEANSFPSSLVSSNGSATTRASESLSMDLTQAGFNGGPVTIVSETEGGRGVYPQSFVLTDGTSSNQISVYRNSTAATTTTNWYLSVASDGSNQVLANIPASNTAGKLAVSLNTDDAAFTTVGNSVTTDTSVTIPSGLSQLKIGASWTGGTNHLNGHVKRLAVFGEALSDTNLISLTK